METTPLYVRGNIQLTFCFLAFDTESDFEYAGFSIRLRDDHLLKHLDHLNDWLPGYNHVCVYSFFVMEYRFTIVMTFRRSWGRLMERMSA